MKVFKDKKQDLRELVYTTDSKGKNLVPTANMRIRLIKAIDELQLSLPPTCGTCDYCDTINRMGFFCSNLDVNKNPARPDFGCNKHSYYEKQFKGDSGGLKEII